MWQSRTGGVEIHSNIRPHGCPAAHCTERTEILCAQATSPESTHVRACCLLDVCDRGNHIVYSRACCHDLGCASYTPTPTIHIIGICRYSICYAIYVSSVSLFSANDSANAFPDSRPRYSNLHPNVDTSDPYTRARPHTNAMFQNLSMTGSGKDLDTQAALVCLHLNFESKHSKIGMLDSGCNNPMQALTDDVRESVMDFDPHGRITGDQVSGEFTTDASGTLGITLNGVSPTGATFAFDFIVEKMQLVVISPTTSSRPRSSPGVDVMCFFMAGSICMITIKQGLARFVFTK